ncbi:MAG: glycosyltransferase family 4 protein [Patescibacteria group bacterium]|nr:glycosyltransferase family 4 protein [Patescibacteria group bacterium]
MTIAYVANMRLPTEKAHGAQIMKVCEAFVRAGQDLALYVPTRRNMLTGEPLSYYGVTTPFPIRYIAVPDTVGWGAVGFVLQSLRFGARAQRAVPQEALVYGRDEWALVPFALGGRRFVWESHDGRWTWAARFIARRAARMVVVTQSAKEFYISKGISAEKIVAVPNGIDTAAFAHHESCAQARERLGLPRREHIALYIGALGGWKGTDTLCEASNYLQIARIAVIGGSPGEVERMRAKYPKVMFVGARPFRELANNQAAADVLVVPNSAKNEIAVRFTSPLKLIAHLASGVPIVASDLPSTREIAGQDAAVLVEPDNPQALAQAIEKVLADEGLSARVVAAAKARATQFDWSVRAQAVLRFIAPVLG